MTTDCTSKVDICQSEITYAYVYIWASHNIWCWNITAFFRRIPLLFTWKFGLTTGAVLIIHELVIHGMYLGMTRGQITILPQPEIQRSFGGIPWKTTTICDESCPSSMDLTSGGKLPPQHKHGTLDL